MRTSLFSWGYWGWGTAPKKFVRAARAVESARGFGPPFFVDIRLQRAARAPAFQGATFSHFCGADSYSWMPELGNRAVREGGAMRIRDPRAAAKLLELAAQLAKEKRRVIFFCACQNASGCHRRMVGDL